MSHTSQAPDHLALAEQVAEEFRQRFLEVVALTDEFCHKHLNDEYQEACRRMAGLMCLPGFPVMQGKPASWASGIAYCVGQVNFLTDPTQTPHMRTEEIARAFGVSVATMQSKARTIREGLNLMPFDPEFTLPSRVADNPLVWMLEVNGLLIDIRHAHREAQVLAFEQGLIPYVPADGVPAHFDWPLARFSGAAEDVDDEPPAPRTDVIYQLKITLEGVEPTIWRRIEVPDCTLDRLHDYIQVAMGWEDCHMHQFIVGKVRFLVSEACDGDEDYDESWTLLSDIVPERSRKFRFMYEYDFGDGWRHEIAVERRAAPEAGVKYPRCVAGERACPLEDCGGAWRYMNLLDAIADPKHEHHDDYMEWCGELDPEAFDAEKTSQTLRRLR